MKPRRGGVLDSLASLARFTLRAARWPSWRALAFLLLASLTEGISVFLLLPLLQLATSTKELRWHGIVLPPGFGPHAMAGLLAIFICLVALRGLLLRAKEIALADAIQQVAAALRVGLFTDLAFARWAYTATLRMADLDHALSAEATRVQLALYNLFAAAQAWVMLLIYAVLGLWLAPFMTLYAASGGIALFVLARPARRAMAALGEGLALSRQEDNRAAAAFTANVKLAKSCNAEPLFIAKFAARARVTGQVSIALASSAATSALISQTLTALLLASFTYAGYAAFHVPLPKLMLLLLLLLRMAPRVTAVQETAQQLLVNLPAYDYLRGLAQSCAVARESTASLAAPLPSRAIRFAHVSFAHQEAPTPSLHDVSFTIPVNEVTALVGRSGSGKSTTADLLLGLLEPDEGRILVDDQLLEAAHLRAWRGHVAYVPQDAALLHDSIYENLRLGLPEADEPSMWEALALAGAADFVRALPGGLHGRAGERGQKLSGGERQRIALARALLRAPRLLILDEATSALDWEAQSRVTKAIAGLRGRMTVVTIAHRPSMIAVADWVVVLEAGRVAETGTRTELLAAPGSRLRGILAAERLD